MAFIDKNLLTQLRRDTKVIPINCSFTECPAWQGCPQVPYQGQMFGKSQAKVFFLFDGASSEDGSVGMPLMSNAGVYFRRVFLPDFLRMAGGVSYLNVNLVANALVKPDGTSRPPTSDEIHVCWFNFLELLMKHRPELIMCFGNGVFEILYKRAKNKEELPLPEDHKISRLRGTPYKIAFTDDYKPTILCTYSPSFVLRTPTVGDILEEDRQHAISLLKPELSSKYVKERKEVTIDQINVVESVKETLDFIDFLTRGFKEPTPIAFDIETSNLNRVYNNKLLSLQFSYEFGKAFVLPIEHPERNLFQDPRDLIKLVEALQKLFSSSQSRTKISWLVGHGLKFDFGVLYGRFRLLMRGNIPLWDTLLGMHWLDENLKGRSVALGGGKPYSLKTIGKKEFGFSYKSEHLNAREEGDLSSLAFEDFAEYGGSDVILNLHLFHAQLDMAERQKDNPLNKLKRFMRYYYSPATRSLAVMECNGLYVPREHLQYLQGASSPIWNRLEQIEKVELQNCQEVIDFRKKYKSRLTGSGISYAEDVWGDEEEEVLPPFDPNKQLQQELFFAKFLKLSPLKKTAKNKASYDKGFLKHYAEPFVYFEEPVIAENYAKNYATEEDEYRPNPLALILEQRELKKLGTTYSSGMEAMLVDPMGDCVDSRIRSSYHLHGTDTGRASSSNPNFQNLPAGKSKHAKEIKNMFQAEPPNRRYPKGTCLIQLDYKTAEVRWAAIFARDQNLIKIFNDAREDLKKACDPNSNMTDEEFAQSQLASDLHRRTASLMFGVPPDKVESSMRQASKCVIGSTLIYTNKGILPIESLVEDPCDDNWVQPVSGLSVASLGGYVDVLRVNHKWVDRTIRLEASGGLSIQGDEDHWLVLSDGVEKPLRDIDAGDFLLAYDFKSAFIPKQVLKKTYIEGRIKVYDIEVNDPKHMFVANGLLSKNCITFGIMYGMGVKTLAISNGWTLPEAEDKVNKFFSAFSTLNKWLHKAQDVAKKKGFSETLMGRRRRLAHLFETKDFRNEQKANKLAMNAPIQGQSSDAGIIGLLCFVDYLIKNGLERTWLVQNVVHDSCLIQVPFEDIRTALPIIQYCFVDGMSEYLLKYFGIDLPLPIECEIELGLKYGGLIKWDGRPKTLTEIIAKLEAQADALWRQPQDTSKYDLLDLVKK